MGNVKPTVTYSTFLEQVNAVSVESQYLHQLADTPAALEAYKSNIFTISSEAFEQDDANKLVDKGFDLAGKALQAAYRILKAIFNKLIALGKRFKQFLGLCLKRGHVVKNSLLLTQSESKKIIDAVKRKCDEWIKAGNTKEYELVGLVDMVIESTGIKSEPIDKESPAIVRQWLETINLSGLKFTRIKGLEYTIPQEVWYLYAFHPRKVVFSEELIKMQTDINNYYLKLILNLRTYLSQDRFFAMLRETLSGKYTLVKDTVVETLLSKMLEPLYQFELPREKENITDNTFVQQSDKTVRSIFESSHNKLAGFEAAITLFTPALIEGNPKLYVPYQEIKTDIIAMAKISTLINQSIQVIETNLTHVLGRNNEEMDVKLPNENNLQRLLNEVLDKQVTNRSEIALAVVDVCRLLERVKQNVCTYWQDVSARQLKCLDKQQQGLLKFLPLI